MQRAARDLLTALRQGAVLKVHRTVDGAKVYRLHGAGATGGQGGSEEVAAGLVDSLERGGYLQSNMKFPAATLLLTEQGLAATAASGASLAAPAGPRRY